MQRCIIALALLLALTPGWCGRIADLTAQYAQGDTAARLQAVEALSAIDNPRVVEALVTALDDADPAVRTAAAYGLQIHPADPLAIPALIRALREGDEELTTAVAGTLWDYRDAPITAQLLPLLHDASPRVRRAVINLLIRKLSPGPDRAPLRPLLADPDPLVRIAAAEALEWAQNDAACKVLLDVCANTDPAVRAEALAALGRGRDYRAIAPLLAALRDPEATVRRAAVEGLRDLHSPKIVPALLDVLQDKDSQVVELVIEALFMRKDDPRVLPRLSALLKDEHYPSRDMICYRLLDMNDPQALALIKKAIDEGDVAVMLTAGIYDSLDLPQDEGLMRLALEAVKSPDARLRNAGLYFIRSTRDPKWLEDLLPALRHPDPEVRQYAHESIREMTWSYPDMDMKPVPDSARDQLYTLMDDPDLEVRGTALLALGQLADPEVFDPARALAASAKPEERQLGLQVLAALVVRPGKRDPRVLAALEQAINDPVLPDEALEVLVKVHSPKVVPLLMAQLRDDDRNRVRRAVDLLREVGAPAVDALLELLDDPDETIRACAVSALERPPDTGMQETEAQAGLLAVIRDVMPEARRAAVEALQPGENVLPTFRELARDPDPVIRRSAATALERSRTKEDRQLRLALTRDPDPRVRQEALRTVNEDSAADALAVKLAALRDADAEVRHEALMGLLTHREAKLTTAVLPLLHDPDPRVRVATAWNFSYRPDDMAFAPLVDMLKDNDAEVRGRAVDALARSQHPDRDKPLLTALHDTEYGVRMMAVPGLRPYRTAPVTLALLDALEDPYCWVRSAVVDVLAARMSPRVLEALLARWEHEQYASVRLAIAAALKGNRDPRAQAIRRESRDEWWFCFEQLDSEVHEGG